MYQEITVDTFREDPTPEKAAELIVLLVADRDSWKEQAHEATLLAGGLAAEKQELQALVARQSTLINRLHRERDSWKEQAEEVTHVTTQINREVGELKAENQKLRDAVVQAPFTPLSREVTPEYDHDHD